MSEAEFRLDIHEIAVASFAYGVEGSETSIPSDVHFNVTSGVLFNLDLKRVMFRIELSSTGRDNSSEHLDITCFVIFSVPQLESYKQVDGFNIPRHGLGMMASITYSTLRGVLFEKLRGTAWHGVILPIIDPMDLVPDGPLSVDDSNPDPESGP